MKTTILRNGERCFGRAAAHPHICIRACGAAALSLMSALTPVRGIEVTLLSPRAASLSRVRKVAP